MTEAEVIVTRTASAGVLTLNRPKALNALTHGMVLDIAAALGTWQNDPAITRVVVRAAGDRAFCAGGDIRVVHDLGKAGKYDEALVFFRDEYRMNRQIKRYPKPYISLIDGIVMGGGVGVSLHGSHRIGGDKYSFAMPEVGIGFFPDVGGTYALPRLPYNAGTYLALTGARIGRADAVALGLVTHAVASRDFPELEAALTAGGDIKAALARFAIEVEPAPILQHKALIERIFGLNTVSAIMEALDKDGSDFAKKTLSTMKSKSPTSLVLALEQLKRGKDLSFEDCMTIEMRIVSHVLHGHEFYEGIRAAIIDKDQSPKWSPPSVKDVDAEELHEYFDPIADDLRF